MMLIVRYKFDKDMPKKLEMPYLSKPIKFNKDKTAIVSKEDIRAWRKDDLLFDKAFEVVGPADAPFAINSKGKKFKVSHNDSVYLQKMAANNFTKEHIEGYAIKRWDYNLNTDETKPEMIDRVVDMMARELGGEVIAGNLEEANQKLTGDGQEGS